MLVGTNFIRELLNNVKAKSSVNGELVCCAAHDLVDGLEPTAAERKRLLGLNLADFSSEGALPGFIPLYVGMPVILRNRNVSTELGITNGSQGTVKKIFTKSCVNNYSLAKCVIVDFPDSNVEIPGLPAHHFPLVPTTWKFTTATTDSAEVQRNIHVSRSQLNLQPAFAITGHAAQGKTLPQVLVDLHEGGFAAYVSASRARTREGLFLTEEITLENLNRTVSSDLRQECRRLQRLEYNTKVRYGVETGPMLPALDPESETIATSDLGTEMEPPTTRVEQILAQPQQVTPKPQSSLRQNPPDRDKALSLPAGCMWVANSCAYDTFFMLMFSIYRDSSGEWKSLFQSMGAWYLFLVNQFECLMTPANFSSTERFSECRDRLRTLLSQHDSELFSPSGERHTSIRQVFEILEKSSCRNFTLSQKFTCARGCESECNILHLPDACTSGNWTNTARRTGFVYRREEASIQLFIDLQIAAKIQRGRGSWCSRCQGSQTSQVHLRDPSPWLYFGIPPNVRPHPELPPTLEIRGDITNMLTYRLSAVVYYNGQHFTGAWANRDTSCWGYDGLAHNGAPEQLCSVDLARLRSYAGCHRHIAIYSFDHSVVA